MATKPGRQPNGGHRQIGCSRDRLPCYDPVRFRQSSPAPHRPGHARGLLPINGFDPGSSVTDPNIALSQLLTADLLPGSPFALSPMAAGGHDLTMTASVATPAIRKIVAAGLARCPVWLLYAAKAGRQEFVFHPSALVRSRGRYHMRGYRSDGYGEARRRLSEAIRGYASGSCRGGAHGGWEPLFGPGR